MDAPDVEVAEPAPCPVCGEIHTECDEALLLGMALKARDEVERRLSPQGKDALGMVEHAAEALPGGLYEAWDLANNIDRLKREEIQALETYFARETLIDHARSGLYK